MFARDVEEDGNYLQKPENKKGGGKEECVTCLIPSPECPSIPAESLQPFFFRPASAPKLLMFYA